MYSATDLAYIACLLPQVLVELVYWHLEYILYRKPLLQVRDQQRRYALRSAYYLACIKTNITHIRDVPMALCACLFYIYYRLLYHIPRLQIKLGYAL